MTEVRSAAESRIQTFCGFILATVATAFALYWLQSVLVPFVLSLFIALGLQPLIDVLTKRARLPRTVAVIVTLAFAVAMLVLVGVLITTSANRLAADALTYQVQLRELIENGLARLPLEQFGLELTDVVRLPLQTISAVGLNIANTIVSLVSQGTVVLLFLGFLLLGGNTQANPIGGVWAEAKSRVKRYIVFKFVISAVTGIAVGLILGALGINFAAAFGLMAFLLNFIPSIGSIVATLLPLPVALVSPDATPLTITLAVALPGALQITVGNVIEPKLMGDELDLHPITILLALMIWGALWGIVGMLLATPMVAVMKIMFEKGELTRPVANLLAGRFDDFYETP
jgi:AI-2 transport protein TqsA